MHLHFHCLLEEEMGKTMEKSAKRKKKKSDDDNDEIRTCHFSPFFWEVKSQICDCYLNSTLEKGIPFLQPGCISKKPH
jgi:hypothetical protein